MDTSNNGRKTIREFENPIDNIYIDIGEKLNPIFKSLKFTPNTLTTFSLLFGILSAYNLQISNNKISAIFLITSYIFDCFDGNYARKYNMETKFGDLYDHYSDLFQIILVYYTMYTLNKKKFKSYLIIFILILLLPFIQLGCQQYYYNNNQEESLDNLKILCPDKNWIKYTRYFGPGTCILYMAYIIWNW